MKLDEIDVIVRRANPVPDVSMLERVDSSALLEQDRRTDVETLERAKQPDQRGKPRRRPWLAIAAAIVLVAVGVIVVMQRDDDSEGPVVPAATTPAPSTDAAVTTAAAFFDALVASAPDVAASFVSPQALTDTYGGADGLRAQLAWADATGLKRTRSDCTVSQASAAGTRVRCPYTFTALRSDDYGLGPFGDSYFDITVDGGTIVGVTDHVDTVTNDFGRLVWEPFAQWLLQEHPEDGPRMYAEWPDTSTQRFDEQSTQLWQRHTRQYVDANRVGFVGLPPADAPVSDPVSGTIVKSFEWCGGALVADSGLQICSGETRVYDDGRVIWYYRGNIPEGATAQSTGWLEQHLTPDGVTALTQLAQPSDAREMALQLRDESAWPAGTWDAHAISPFVPSSYSVCVQPFAAQVAGGAPTSPQVFPGEVANVDNGWTWVEHRDAASNYFAYCSEQSLDTALGFATLLPHDGGALVDVDTMMLLDYQFADPRAAGEMMHVVFVPVM
jgi:hypothetical protein